jgi:prepilin-type N-terminal cleavage/methylation domain-containing protein
MRAAIRRIRKTEMDRRRGGFTLIELMVVVAIIGVLCSVAVPVFMENARRAKTTEAPVNLERIYSNSRIYIFAAHASRGSINPIPLQFPEPQPKTPVAACCGNPGGKCIPNPLDWATPTWGALAFSMDDPSYFNYEYGSTGTAVTGPGSNFTARAMGDLDCDTVLSTFELVGTYTATEQDMLGSGGMFINLPTE